MTSTSFNIGLTDSKNSSRVLRPPGGGHSDIFGKFDTNEIKTPSKRNYPTSTIGGCFTMDEKKTEPKIATALFEDNKIAETESGLNGNITDENTEPLKENGNIIEEPKDISEVDKAQAPRRGRVPPGGYSSGFW